MKWEVISGLRFFLAWIVVCYHLRSFVPNYAKDFFCQFGKLNGFAAVLVFLLISGYSIAHSITKKPEGFYERRILRIYPLYFCAVIVPLVEFLILGPQFKLPHSDVMFLPDLWTVLGNLFFLQTIIVKTVQSNVALWTLSIEVICYILAPLFIKMSKRRLSYLIYSSALLYVIFPEVYHACYPHSPFPFYNHWQYGLPFCLFLWAWLLGFLYVRENEKISSKFTLVGLGCLVLVINQNHTGQLGIITYFVGSLVLVYSSSIKLKLSKSLRNAFTYLGDISYPLYLFHMPTFIFSYSVLKIQNSFTLVFLCLLISMLFYHAIDVPLRSRKLMSQG